MHEKFDSKAAIATLLAGFMFAALVELLLVGRALTDLQAIAAGLLTLALGLFETPNQAGSLDEPG